MRGILIYNQTVMTLKGKTAIVTGASEGIGKQVAIKLAAQQTNLALIARTEKNLQIVKEEISKDYPRVKVAIYPCDLTKTADLKKTILQIINNFSGVQILLNIAGIWQKKDQLDAIPPETVDAVIATNLTGLIHCTRLILPILRQQSQAAIINVSSRSGFLARENQSVYSASKWGVRGFTEVLKNDLKGSSVRVAGFYQGRVKTDLFSKANDDVNIEKYSNPADIADVIIYMLTRPEKLWLHDVRVEY